MNKAKELLELISEYMVTDTPEFKYFHVTDRDTKPILAVSKERTYKDPLAIYLFPKGKRIDAGGWEDKKWRWDANIKSNAKFFDLNSFNRAKAIELLKAAGIYDQNKIQVIQDKLDSVDDYWHNLHDVSSGDGYLYKTYEVIREHFSNSKKFADFWKHLGFDVLADLEGFVLYGGEPQIIVLDDSVIEWGEKKLNKKVGVVQRSPGLVRKK